MIWIDGTELKVEIFKNGEIKIPRPRRRGRITHIELKWESDQDFMNLLFVKKHLDNFETKGIFLSIYYMPYSRMDRAMGGDIFTLPTICDFINDMNFSEVIIYEPHSDVTPALLKRCTVRNTSMDLFFLIQKTWEPEYICYPDAGAAKRYDIKGYEKLIGLKKRDPNTGQIIEFSMIGNQNLDGATVVIIDDLSSFGGTFVFSAEKLKEMGAGDIYLIVAHAEKNILAGKVFDGNIRKVLTTNSILDINDSTNRLEIIDITTL